MDRNSANRFDLSGADRTAGSSPGHLQVEPAMWTVPAASIRGSMWDLSGLTSREPGAHSHFLEPHLFPNLFIQCYR